VSASPSGASLLAAALLLAGCVTETRTVGRDAGDAAERAGWGGKAEGAPGEAADDAPHDAFFDPPPRDPDDVVEVPVAAWEPLDLFFDGEGYLIGDRVEIDCSYQPFLARMVGLGYEKFGQVFIVREESREGSVHTIRLRNLLEGPAYQANLVPRASFAAQRRGKEVRDEAGRPVGLAVRPVFEIVASEVIVVRMHLEGDAARSVWFHARATGTPDPLRPDTLRDCVYVNARRGRRVKAPSLELHLEVSRGADGEWRTVIGDPGR
jgi:hypothetical protein